ncbi:MAG: SpoIIE family protein phosphatase [Chlorobi bacterium]|nr:SpoIIE family protein phosphatase [Chlorobiota bacterium]
MFKLDIENSTQKRKLEYLILALIILLLYKFLYPTIDDTIFSIINDLFIYITIAVGFYYAAEFTSTKLSNPISLVLNVGILTAILFFLTSLSSVLFDSFGNIDEVSGLGYTIISVIVSLIFISFTTYILSAIRELFFLRQKRPTEKYFNIMLAAIAVASISATLAYIFKELQFVEKTFYVVSIVLIVLNSFRVSWIAFLTKRQKLFLLFLSSIMSVLFSLNAILLSETNIIEQVLFNFSTGVDVFIRLVMLYGNIYFGIVFITTLFHLPTAGAFDQKSEEVSSLIDLSKLMTQVLDFKELGDSITLATNNVCNSDSSWLVTEEDSEHELVSVSNIGYVEADGITREILNEIELPINKLITLNKKAVKVKIKDDTRTFMFHSLVVVPLKVHKKNNGYLFAVKRQKYYFDVDEKKALGAFADYAAVALENAKLIKESIYKERLESELDAARDIQSRILPDETPQCDELDVEALFVPAFEVGGDYYDFFELDDDKLGFVIADVSGKGISASYIMAEVKGIFESLSRVIESPKELLIKANDILKHSLGKKDFVTALYGVINIKSGKVVFARAGHMPLVVCSGKDIKSLKPRGIGLGLDSSEIFSTHIDNMEFQLNNNDILILYTDGVTESQNSNDEDFGEERFYETIVNNCNEELSLLTNKIFRKVILFSQDKEQHDDITLVLFKWKNNNKMIGEV